jgi:hypothetical protein
MTPIVLIVTMKALPSYAMQYCTATLGGRKTYAVFMRV